MKKPSPIQVRKRVVDAAEAVLIRAGSVGPLELLQEMLFLHPTHVEAWRKGNEYYPDLENWIQVGPDKFRLTLRYFADWVKERGLRPIEASYKRSSIGGTEELRITADGNPEQEKFYRTHYAPADLNERQSKQLTKKLHKTPDLVVFIKVSQEGKCGECGTDLVKGEFVFKENDKLLCLTCADLDHLVFLPAGDTALTRRARKHSRLSAVVVRFSRSRRRYERQGLLVEPDALAQAEEECVADASERAAARSKAAIAREAEDRELMAGMTKAILERYPACPPDEAASIATHTAQRSSGRVGRSEAGRALQAKALDLAVIAHVRHEHTRYDTLLMQGVDRLDARQLVRDKIDTVFEKWRSA